MQIFRNAELNIEEILDGKRQLQGIPVDPIENQIRAQQDVLIRKARLAKDSQQRQ